MVYSVVLIIVDMLILADDQINFADFITSRIGWYKRISPFDWAFMRIFQNFCDFKRGNHATKGHWVLILPRLQLVQPYFVWMVITTPVMLSSGLYVIITEEVRLSLLNFKVVLFVVFVVPCSTAFHELFTISVL
jgi:hypothetical protein